MKTLLSRANLEAHVASKEPGRYAINGIYLAEEGTISTDGRKLLLVPYPTESAEDHPIEFSSSADENSNPILPIAAAKKIARNLPKKSARPILSLAVLESSGDRITASATDLETRDIVKATAVEAHFPDCSAVIPETSAAAVTVKFSVVQLTELLAAAKKADASIVNLGLSDDPTVATRWDFLSGPDDSSDWTDERHPIGVLMPIMD